MTNIFVTEFAGRENSIGIFVQLPVEINWRWLPAESILMQIYMGHFTMN